MSDDKKQELPFCLSFALRYCKRVRSKIDKIGCDWMSPKVHKDWFFAGLIFDLLYGLVEDDDRFDYKLFVLLGYKLIDLVSSVNFALTNLDDKKEN